MTINECTKFELINIVNRQQAEIERLKAKCENTQVGYNFAKADIDEFRKEIFERERIYKAEIGRLQTEKDNIIKTFGECQKEAIKEFAELIVADYPEMEFYLKKLLAERAGEQNV